MPSGLGWLRTLDVYPKAEDHLKERTLGGGIISLVCVVLACTLLVTEWRQHRAVETIDRCESTRRVIGCAFCLLHLCWWRGSRLMCYLHMYKGPQNASHVAKLNSCSRPSRSKCMSSVIAP
eukprot:6194324-Pleurochrysis_carterae.AAC.5